MFARIATFTGVDPSRIDEVVEANRASIDDSWDNAPEGLAGIRGVWMRVDRENGRGMGISLFDTREDLERGDATLDAMSPPAPDTGGRRESVQIFEVALRRDRSAPTRA
jgi:hypothetical protein